VPPAPEARVIQPIRFTLNGRPTTLTTDGGRNLLWSSAPTWN